MLIGLKVMKTLETVPVKKDDIYLINAVKRQLNINYGDQVDKNDKIQVLVHNIVIGVGKALLFFDANEYVGMIYTFSNEKNNEILVNYLIASNKYYRKLILNFIKNKYEFFNVLDSEKMADFYLKNGMSILQKYNRVFIFTNIKGFEVKNYRIDIPQKNINWALKTTVESYQSPFE